MPRTWFRSSHHACRVAICCLPLLSLQARAHDDPLPAARPSSLPISPMQPTASETTTLDAEGARLQVTFVPAPDGNLAVRYRVTNTGAVALAVFDRGHRHAVLTGRQRAGAVGAPTFEHTGDGDVVLRHVALPVAQGVRTGPIVPATPLALQLDPGATLDGEFTFAIPTAAPPRRVRWCLGIAPFDAARFVSSERTDAGEVWQAGDDAVRGQRILCTPWFGLAEGDFATESPATRT